MLLPLHLNGLNLDSGTAVAVVTGTASSGLTEAQVVSGGETIVITLTNDTWVAAGATFDAQRQNIIDGLDSAQAEATGWNAEVRDKEVVGAVVRTSDTVVTITLTAAAAYDVTSDEEITVTVPATALVTSGSDLTATPTFGVTADVEAAAATGGLTKLQRRRRAKTRYLVEIDGQFFDADSIDAVQAQLAIVRDTVAEAAERDAEAAPVSGTTGKIRIKPPRIKVTTSAGRATTSITIRQDVERTQKAVNRIYRQAQQKVDQIRQFALQREIRRKKRRKNDEEAVISLLF